MCFDKSPPLAGGDFLLSMKVTDRKSLPVLYSHKIKVDSGRRKHYEKNII